MEMYPLDMKPVEREPFIYLLMKASSDIGCHGTEGYHI